MAPSKRKENVTANRVAKHSKVEKAPEVVVPEEHKPVLALLDEAVQLGCASTGSRDMLKMALPSVFSTGEEDRHEFQNRMVELFDAVFADSERKILDMVGSEKARLTAAQADKDKAEANSEGVRQSIETQQEEASAASAALQSAGTSAVESQQNLDSLCAKESAARSDHASAEESAQRIHVLLHEHWKAVQTANTRKKEVQKFMAMFSAIDGLEESLIDGLSVALQTEAAARGSFAGQALEYGEQAMKDHHEALVKEAGNRETEMQAATDAVASAKEQLKTADEHKHSCKEKLKEVTAHGVTLKKQLKEALGLQKQDEQLVEEVQKELAVLESKMEQFSSWLAQYQTLKSAPAPDSNSMKSEAPAVAEAEAEAVEVQEVVQKPLEVEMAH